MSAFYDLYNNNYVFILYKNEFRRVTVADIMIVEASRSYCSIYLSGGEKILLSIPMIRVYNNLRMAQFVRVSRSYIVNIMHIKSIRGNCVMVDSHRPILMAPEIRRFVFSTFVFIGTRKHLVSRNEDLETEEYLRENKREEEE